MERANPELISAVKSVIEAFLEGGAGEAFTNAARELSATVREFGGRDALTEAAFEFKVAMVTGKVDLTPLYKALNEELASGTQAAQEAVVEAPVAPEEPITDPTPYLYILMRTDLGSMNAGKAVAQGSHAANQMVYEAMIKTDPLAAALDPNRAKALAQLVGEWSGAARGFGTCIVLGVNEGQMRSVVAAASEAGLHAGITHDPSYPVKDGDSFYTLPLDTCGYVFARKCDAAPFTKGLRLMP